MYLDNSEFTIFFNKRSYSSDKIKENYSSNSIAKLEKLPFMNDYYKKQNYYIQKKLGSGNFGRVKLGIYLPTKEKVAIKIIDKSKLKEKSDIIRLRREFEILFKVDHPNIVKARDYFEDKNFYYTVMDYCEGDDLYNYVMKKGYLSEEESSFFFYQLINGVEYIHSLGIVHRDLKPENILLTKDHILKIIDFGLSNYFYKGQMDLLSTPCGTPCYASPEIIKGIKYDGFMIDIWNCGIILFIMLCGYYPFYFGDNEDNDDMFKNILECNIEYPNYISNNIVDLLKKIIVTNPKERISIEEIKKHPFYIKGKYNFENNFNIILINNNNNKYEEIRWKKYKQNSNNAENDKKEQRLHNNIDTKNHKANININNIMFKKYKINWKKYKNKIKKEISKNLEKNQYFPKYTINNTIQDDNNIVSNENKIIKTEVNYLNIINNKIIISPKTLNKNKKAIFRNNLKMPKNPLCSQIKNGRTYFRLRKFKAKIIKSKTIDKENSKIKNNSKSQIKNEQKDKKENNNSNKVKLMNEIEKLFYNKRNKINNFRINPEINNNNKKMYRKINSVKKTIPSRNNKSIEKSLTTTLHSAKINIITEKNYSNKDKLLKRNKKNCLYKIQLNKNNLNNYRSIEYKKNLSSKIKNKNKILFTELYNNNSLTYGNKFKKHFLISNLSKNNKISELKKKLLLKNNDNKNKVKKNLISKEKSLKKNNSLSIIPKGPKNKTTKMKKAKLKLGKEKLDKDNDNDAVINKTEVLESKTLKSEDCKNYIFPKFGYNKVKPINFFSSRNNTICSNIGKNKNNRKLIIQKTYDKKGFNSKIKKIKKNVINRNKIKNDIDKNQSNRVVNTKISANSLSLSLNKDITLSNTYKK